MLIWVQVAEAAGFVRFNIQLNFLLARVVQNWSPPVLPANTCIPGLQQLNIFTINHSADVLCFQVVRLSVFPVLMTVID